MSDETIDKDAMIAPVQGYAAGIPWWLHCRAYDVYAKRHGHQQSPKRIAERGGFSVEELDEFIPGWKQILAEFEESGKDKLIEAMRAENEQLKAAIATPEVYAGVVSRVVEEERGRAIAELSRLRQRLAGARRIDMKEELSVYGVSFKYKGKLGRLPTRDFTVLTGLKQPTGGEIVRLLILPAEEGEAKP